MNFFDTILTDPILFWQVLAIMGIVIALSLGFGFLFCLLKQKEGYFKDVPITLVIFPIVCAAVSVAIMAISGVISDTSSGIDSRYVRAAVALLAVFVCFRFRSMQRTTEDLVYIFFSAAYSLLLGMGFIWPALLLYAVIVGLFVLFHFVGFPLLSRRNLNLKVSIPEDLNYENVFDDIFEKYTKYHELTKIKTSDMGTMFTLNYEIITKPHSSTKEMVDEIRSRNGNLNVVVTVKKYTTIEN